MAPWRLNLCYSLQPCMHVRSRLSLAGTAIEGSAHHAREVARGRTQYPWSVEAVNQKALTSRQESHREGDELLLF